MDVMWTLFGRTVDGFWTVSVGICGRDLLDKVLPRQKLFSSVFWIIKEMKKGLLGMKGSYITTPRYLMHSVKGQE